MSPSGLIKIDRLNNLSFSFMGIDHKSKYTLFNFEKFLKYFTES